MPAQDEAGEAPQHALVSKNKLKKQMRRERYLKNRVERRIVERQKKKDRRRADLEANIERVPKLINSMVSSSNKFRVVIDMDFEDFMTENELGKAAQQVARIYSANRHSESPCQLYVSSLKGKVKDRFSVTNTGYLNWDVNRSELDYLELFDDCKEDKSKFVYLSGDAEDSLPEVDELLRDQSKIYIIGGLVDHNRHKNLCHKRAVERGIPTARLPIKEHITLCQRHILSTVTVFEIMIKVLGSHKSWNEALAETIPKRKIASPPKEAKSELGELTEQTDCDTVESGAAVAISPSNK